MLPFYVFAAILGAGLLLVGILGGDGDVGDAIEGGSTSDLDGGIAWSQLLSSRTLSYVLAAFGLTGVGLTLVGASTLTTFLLAAMMAIMGGALASVVFRWVMGGQGGYGESSASYVGGIGLTEVRIPSDGQGRIQLLHRGRAFTLAATSVDGEIDRNETVVVVDVVEGVAVVGRAPKELTL